MPDLTATLNINAKSNLKPVLEVSNKGFELLNKTVKAGSTELGNFAKEADKIDLSFKSIADGTKGAVDGLVGFTRATQNTYKGTVTTSKAIMGIEEASFNASKGVSGLGLRIVGFHDEVSLLNRVLEGPAGFLNDIADAGSNTERAFIALNAVSTPVTKTFRFLGDVSDRVSLGFKNTSETAMRFATVMTNVAASSLNVFADSLYSVQANLQKTGGFLGKFLSSQVGDVATSLRSASAQTSQFAETLDPDKFKGLEGIGQRLGKGFDIAGNRFDKAAIGVKAADTVGDFYRAALASKEMGAAMGAAAVGGVGLLGTKLALFKDQLATTEGKLNASQQAAQAVNNSIKTGMLSTLAQLTLKAGDVVGAFLKFKLITSTVSDVAKEVIGLNEAMGTVKALGINTYAAELSLSLVDLKDNILLNSQAAVEFGQQTAAAFAQLEESIAFVQTLSAGRNAVESVGGSVGDLANELTSFVNGPLSNMITSGDAATSMYNALSAGVGIAKDGTVSAAETFQFMEGALKLAAGTGTDAAQSVEILAKVNQVYGRSNRETAKTAAQLYGIVEEGITTFPQLAGGLSRAASVAKTSGIQLEEFSGSVAGLTKVMTTDDALTGYASLLNSIAGQGAESSKAVAELGIKFDATTIKTKGLLGPLQDLYKATNGNQALLKRIIPDSLAFTAALNLMTTVGDDAAATMQNIQNTGEETLDTVFDAKRQTVIQRTTAVMNGFNEVLIGFGEKAMPALEPGIALLEKILGVFQAMPDWMKGAIGGLILFQTVMNKVVGVGTSLLMMGAKLVLMTVASRAAHLALTGQLGKELEVLKHIFLVQGDYGKGIKRILGLQQDWEDSSAVIIKAQNKQAEAQKKLETLGLGFNTNNVDSIKQALTEVQQKIDQLNSSGLKFVNGQAYNTQLKNLKRLQKELQSTAKVVGVSQKETLVSSFKLIEKAIGDSTKTALDKQKELVKRTGEIFNSFGAEAQALRPKLIGTFESIMNDSNLTVEQKGQVIRQSFKKMIENLPKETQLALAPLGYKFASAFDSISKNSDKYKERIIKSFTQLKSELPGLFTETGEKTIGASIKFLSELEGDFKTRRKNLANTFDLMVRELPSSFDKVKPQIKQSINALLQDTSIPFETRKKYFTQLLAQTLQGADEEVLKKIPAIKKAFEELAFSIESPIKTTTSRIGDLGDRFATQLKPVISQVEKGASSINDALKRINFDKVLSDVNVFSAEGKQRVQRGLSTIATAVDTGFKQITNQADLDKLKSKINVEVDQINNSLAEISDKNLRITVEQNINQLVTLAQQKVNQLEAKIKQGTKNLVDGNEKASQLRSGARGLAGSIGAMFGFDIGMAEDIKDVITGLTTAQKAETVAKAADTAVETASIGSKKANNILLKERFALIKANTTAQGKLTAFTSAMNTPLNLQTAGFLKNNVALKVNNFNLKSVALSAKGAAVSIGTGLVGAVKGSTAAMITAAGAAKGMLASITAMMGPVITLGATIGALAGVVLLAKEALSIFIPELRAGGAAKFAEGIRELNKEMDTLPTKTAKAQKVFVAGWRRIAINIVEIVTELAAKIVFWLGKAVAEIVNLFKNVGDAIVNFLKDAPKNTIKIATDIRNGFLRAIGLGSLADKLDQWANGVIDRFNKIKNAALDAAENIPLIGKAIEKMRQEQEGGAEGDKKGGFFEQLLAENWSAEGVELGVRDFFNNVREANQGYQNAPGQEAFELLRQQFQKEFVPLQDQTRDLLQGGPATDQGKNILAGAAEAGRALTGEEQAELRKVEVEAYDENQKKIKDTITALQEEADALDENNPLRQNLEAYIGELEGLSIQYEKAFVGAEKYQANLQTLAAQMDMSDAVKSSGATIEAIDRTFQSLPDEMKGRFKEIMGLQTQMVEENGQMVEKVIATNANLTSQTQRRSYNAAQVASATALENIQKAAATEGQVDLDKIQQDAISAIEAIDKAVSDGTFTEAEGEAKKQLILSTRIQIEEFGIDGTLQDTLNAQMQDEITESRIKAIESLSQKEIALEQEKLNEISTARQLNNIGGLEVAEQTAAIQSKIDAQRLEAAQKTLAAIGDAQGKESEAYIAKQREVAQLENEIQVNAFENRKKIIEEQTKKILKELDLQITKAKNLSTKELGGIDLESKFNDQQNKILQSEKEVLNAANEYEIALLQNKAKLTQDNVVKAQVEADVVEKRIQFLDAEQQFERESIAIQQESNKLTLKREEIQLRMNKLEAERAKKEIELQLANKDQLKLREAEVEMLEAQAAGYDVQIGLIGEQQAQLEQFASDQDTMNQNQLDALDRRQAAQRENLQVELELARNSEVLAYYDKVKERLQQNAQIQTEALEDQKAALQAQNQYYEQQANLIEQQKTAMDQISSQMQANSQYAQSQLKTEAAQRREQREAIDRELQFLQTKQDLERLSLEMKIKQRDLALEISIIENQTAQANAEAATAQAEAEAAKVFADSTSTVEQKNAALLGVRAARRTEVSTAFQGEMLQNQRQLNDIMSGFERQNQERQFDQERRGLQQQRAETTRTKSDDRLLRQEALAENNRLQGDLRDSFKQFEQQFSGLQQLDFESFAANYQPGQSLANLQPQTINDLQAQGLGVRAQNRNSNAEQFSQQLGINSLSTGSNANGLLGKIESTINVNFTADENASKMNIDMEKLDNTLRDSQFNNLKQLFQNVQRSS